MLLEKKKPYWQPIHDQLTLHVTCPYCKQSWGMEYFHPAAHCIECPQCDISLLKHIVLDMKKKRLEFFSPQFQPYPLYQSVTDREIALSGIDPIVVRLRYSPLFEFFLIVQGMLYFYFEFSR